MGGSKKESRSIDFSTLADGSGLPSWLFGDTFEINSGVAVNTPTLGDEIVTNGGAEAPYISGLANGWSSYVNTGTRSEETVDVQAGSSSQKLVTGVGERQFIGTGAAGSTANIYVLLSAMIKVSVGSAVTFRLRNHPSGDNSFQVIAETLDEWTKYIFPAKTPSVLNNAAFDTVTGEATVLIDSASIKSVNIETLFARTKERYVNANFGVVIDEIIADNPVGVVLFDSPANPQNMVLIQHTGNRVYVIEYVAGVSSTKARSLNTYVAGEIIEVRKSGATLQLYYKGTQVGANVALNAANSGKMYFGVYSTGTSKISGVYYYVSKTNVPVRATTPVWTTGSYGSGQGVISLRLDDAGVTDYTTIFPALTTRGLTAGFAIPRNRIGLSASYITLANLIEMQTAGMEIMCHSRTHPADPTSHDMFLDETITAILEMRMMGLSIDSWVQPGSFVGDTYHMDNVDHWGTLQDNVLRSYLNSYMAYIVPWDSNSNKRNLPVPAANRWGANTIGTSATLAQIKTIVDECITNGQGTTITTHSNQLDGVGQWTTAEYLELLDYLQTKVTAGDIVVLTPTQQLFATESA